MPAQLEDVLRAAMLRRAADPPPEADPDALARAARRRARSRARARHGGAVLAAAALAAAVTVAIAVPAPTPPTTSGPGAARGGGQPAGPSPSGPRALLLAASREAGAAQPVVKGAVWYEKWHTYSMAEALASSPCARARSAEELARLTAAQRRACSPTRAVSAADIATIEVWTREDGHVRSVRTQPGRRRIVREESAGRQLCFSIGGACLTWAYLQELPADPEALRARLEDYLAKLGKPSGEEHLPQRTPITAVMTDLLRIPAPPAVRAAAFQLLADTPGVKSLGVTTDLLGRSGRGFALPVRTGDSGRITEELVIDDQARLLAVRQVDPRGTIQYLAVFERAAFVDHVGDR